MAKGKAKALKSAAAKVKKSKLDSKSSAQQVRRMLPAALSASPTAATGAAQHALLG
jgi:hypothetical protein